MFLGSQPARLAERLRRQHRPGAGLDGRRLARDASMARLDGRQRVLGAVGTVVGFVLMIFMWFFFRARWREMVALRATHSDGELVQGPLLTIWPRSRVPWFTARV